MSEAVKESPATVYVIKAAHPMTTLLLPKRTHNPVKECLDWLNLVTTVKGLGFRAEHRKGSTITFRGSIQTAATRYGKCSWIVNCHRPRPSPDMRPILLPSTGRRLNARYGWQRDNAQTIDSLIS